MANSNPWNAAEITLIRQLWAADWSAGKIATELDRTRNAVMGFAHRNRDICPRRGSGRVPLVHDPNPRHAKGPRPKSLAPKPKIPDSPPKPPPPPDDSSKNRPQSSAKADLYRMLRRAVLNTGGRL